MTDPNMPEIKMDASSLYREENFTDQKTGTIRRLTPITSDGADDDSRAVIYQGYTQMMTPAGALPLNFDIDASSLAEAVSKYGDAAGKALEDTMQELQEMRREQASKIMVPGEQGNSQIQMP